MTQRVDHIRTDPALGQALGALHTYARGSGLDARLLYLIDVRVSQINGCAYCLNLHTEEARRAGESQQRLDVLAAWWETELFTPEEQAVLRFAEHVTRVSTDHVPDDVYAGVAAHFSERQVVQLIGAILDINAWNRLAIATARRPGRRVTPT